MREGSYTLGVDVGDETVTAAVCRCAPDDRRARPLQLGPTTAARPAVAVLGPDGHLHPDDGPFPVPGHCAGHALRQVGAPAPIYLDSQPVQPADVVAALAAGAAEQALAQEGRPPAWTVLTVPPTWGGHRRELLSDALRDAGLERFSLESSAVTITRHHRGSDGLPADATLAVYDLGASTLDTAVVRTTAADTIETLGAPLAPLPWGGRDLDDAVVDLVRSCLSSEVAGDTVAAVGPPVEFRQNCVAAKEQLSRDTDTRLEVRSPGGPLSLRLVREDLDELIAGSVQASVGTVREAVAAAGLEVADLAAVVLAGGTAAVPLVAETLSAELGRPVVVDDEPALTAALGAAELAMDRVLAEEAEPGPTAALALGRPPRPRGGLRPPVPAGTRRPGGHRVGQRLLVVLGASLALVVGLTALLAAGWTGGPAQPSTGPAAAAAQPPDDLGAPAVDRAPGSPDALSPAAADRPQSTTASRAPRTSSSGTASAGRPAGSAAATGSGSAAATTSGAAAAAVQPGTASVAEVPTGPGAGSPPGTGAATASPRPSTPTSTAPAPTTASPPPPVVTTPPATQTSAPPVVESTPPPTPETSAPPVPTTPAVETTPAESGTPAASEPPSGAAPGTTA
ncbi:Putative heat shock protein Hsp70 [Modestobacter italicus]|uniref:Heat shock protein Hsp70 n=1 Tax=Modestobacter italicus (strain DSM 44449 / CECT 9708 / BC 501) TaxID=2732864 RepID=I4EQ55_MODI5|nr:Hsp70 family protein [Modestobacter marinus]CCH85518.1 Putative heat shock protein Hsp70 [Modestobacter marinus]